MTANSILLWTSARATGSWNQFKAAVEELHLTDLGSVEQPGESGEEDSGRYGLPQYQLLRLNLERMAHAEFFTATADNDWRVTPPALALSRTRQGARAVLTGARSTALIDRVMNHGAELSCEKFTADGYPDQFTFLGNSQGVLERFGKAAGLSVQDNAPLALLDCLPAIDDPVWRRPTAVPSGKDWRIAKWSIGDHVWRAATTQDFRHTSNGLFRFSLRYQTMILLVARGAAFNAPTAVGKYIQLRTARRRIARYDRTSEQLVFPATYRPPFMVERALIMCSGRAPAFRIVGGRGEVLYSEVPEEIARFACQLLRQEFA